MKMIRVSGESRRRRACTSKPFIWGIHTSRTATRHRACLSLARKATGALNFSAMRPAELIIRPSALSMEPSSSRSQIPLRAQALRGEPFVSKSSKRLRNLHWARYNPVLFIENNMGLRSMPRDETLVSSHTGARSQTPRSSGYFSAVFACLRTKTRRLGVVLLRLR